MGKPNTHRVRVCVVCLMVFSAIGLISSVLATTVKITGRRLLVNNGPFTVKGVAYNPVPIGDDPETTSPYGDYFTSEYQLMFKRDLSYLRLMGANTIRLSCWNNSADHEEFLDIAYNNGVNPIYVIITFQLDPAVYPDISSPLCRQWIKADFKAMIATCKNHPAVLFWAIGNGLNDRRRYGDKLHDLFSLIGDMVEEAHREEGPDYHPVTTPLVDVDLIPTIASAESLLADLDIWGVIAHRGASFGDLFSEFKAVSRKPLVIMGCGIDAYDARSGDEYEYTGIPYQAAYIESLYREISANSDVCVGGVVNEYSDEWWRGKSGNTFAFCPDYDPAAHSDCGHPSNSDPDGYVNYEWFGIMRVKKDEAGSDIIEPRKVYATLLALWGGENPDGQPSGSGQASEAAAAYVAAFKEAAEDWQAHRWAQAVEKYRTITESGSPFASKAHIQLGKYFKYHGRWNEAIAEYESAIAKATCQRELEDAQTSIGAVFISKGDYRQALSIFREVITTTGDWQQVKYSTYWIKELKRRMSFGQISLACNTCGQKAIKALLQLRGVAVTDSEVGSRLSSAKAGASLEDLKRFAESKGLKAYGAKLSMDQLKRAGQPLLALIEDPNHYVVITSGGPEGIRIIDPEHSPDPFLMPEKEFTRVWRGYALIVAEIDAATDIALLSVPEMNELKGSVCYCCPESNNGVECPNTAFKQRCVNPVLQINTVNLNLVVQETDVAYSGRGPAVAITRTFNADDSRDGPFGHSWTFNYNVTLTENPNGSIDIRQGTASIHHFTSAGGGRYTPPTGIHDTLVKNADGTYTLKLKGGRLAKHFNPSGKLTRITDRNGNSVNCQYDPADMLVSVQDAAGRFTTITYGANGKISSIRDPLGRTATYTYDTNNNLVATTDMAGNTVTYSYDSNSYLTAITTAKGTTYLGYSTSSDGYALQSITDPLGNVEGYGTYGGHYSVRVINANGNPTLYDNTSSGFNERITDALGRSVEFDYDINGNRTGVRDGSGKTTTLEYDTRGNITKITDPLGNQVQFTYDSNDNITRLTDPKGKATAYEYDGKNNLTKITDPTMGVTSFTYNSFGELTTLTDAKGRPINFTYDNYGNATQVTYPLGNADRYSYDLAGRVIAHTDAKGQTSSFAYDGADHLLQVTAPDAFVKRYTYDCCRLQSAADRVGTVSFRYDQANRLTGVTDVHGKTIAYGYDPAGNLTALTYPDGKTVRYEYDRSDSLIKVTDWLDRSTSYEYDLNGNLIRTALPDGSAVAQRYDDAGQLTSVLDYQNATAAVNARYEYTLDALGNRTAISCYQPLPAVAAARSVDYTYDAENRLLTAGGATYDYDNNGNTIRKAIGENASTYSWDENNMLTQFVDGGNTYWYEYDGLGNRVARTVDGVATRYVVDPGGALSSVLAETDAGGEITAYYVYGLGLISKVTPAGQAYFYHFDGLGSTVAVTDSSGAIVNKYAYDAFGKVSSQEEAVANPFKYIGRFGVMDEGNGLLYMRARYYDPEVGRFINNDPIGLASGVNMYTYVHNNPLNYIDPLGLIIAYKPSIMDVILDNIVNGIIDTIFWPWGGGGACGGGAYSGAPRDCSITGPPPGADALQCAFAGHDRRIAESGTFFFNIFNWRVDVAHVLFFVDWIGEFILPSAY